MHEALRRRIVRRLETLPEPKLYQVLDYIEFLESQYAHGVPEETSGLQKLAERLEDGLRSRTMSPSRLREAFQLISAADRVLSSVSEAGRDILSDLQAMGEGQRSPEPTPDEPESGEKSSPTDFQRGLDGDSSRG